MKRNKRPIEDAPIYGVAEAARYLRIPTQTLSYWVTGQGRSAPLVRIAQKEPAALSFLNLLECHVLVAMKKDYNLRLRKVRRAIETLEEKFPSPRPLLDRVLHTDRENLYLKSDDYKHIYNLSQGGQMSMVEIIETHLQRIERDESGLVKLFPFVRTRQKEEPRWITITPSIGFGKPVISATGISTLVIASRFMARESASQLAEEYGCAIEAIEEAVRWEKFEPIAA